MSVTITKMKILGDSSGNVAEVDSSNQLKVIDPAAGPVTPGTVATKSELMGGQYNATLPTLTDTQQAATQVDSRGRLLVAISSVAATVAPNFSNKLKAEATVTPISVTSSVTYTTIYTYSGSGYFIGFNHEYNSTSIVIKLVIDGNTVFDGFDIGQYNSLAVTSNATTRYQAGQGIISSSSVFDFSFKYPIAYSSSVVISSRLTSGAVAKSFQQGIVYIQKDT